MEINVQYGVTSSTIFMADCQFVRSHRNVEPLPRFDVVAFLDRALRQPIEFPPLASALTPDDNIAIVVDHEVGELTTLVSAISCLLESAGIRANQIVVVLTHQVNQPGLATTWPGIRVERHDPHRRDHLAYVASTKAGRRVYMNRTVAEADQIIVVAQARFGLSAGRWLYPLLSDHPDKVTASKADLDDEIKEVCWLMGLPFFIQVIPGYGDSISEIMAGPMESFRTVKQHLNERWRVQFDRMAETTLACISGSAESVSITDMARAVHNAARVTEPGGTIVVLMDAAPDLDAGFELIEEAPTIAAAMKSLPKDHVAAQHWLSCLKSHRVYVLSGFHDEAVEELFVTPIQSLAQVQKLVAGSASVIYLADAHRSHAEVAN